MREAQRERDRDRHRDRERQTERERGSHFLSESFENDLPSKDEEPDEPEVDVPEPEVDKLPRLDLQWKESRNNVERKMIQFDLEQVLW